MSLMSLTWIDFAILLGYLASMLAFGLFLARRRRTEDEYFLAGRSMPWFIVGLSVVASLLSSLTYLAEPGEVWKSGVTHVLGKLLGVPVAGVLVWVVCIPFLMRFRFTSAYEYLELRFGRPCRRWGVVLFTVMVVLWMAFVVRALSLVLHQVSGISLLVVMLTIGAVSTTYTMLGGLRAVIWTDVVQVALLVAGGAATIGSVMWSTGSSLHDWLSVAHQHLVQSGQLQAIPLFSWDPTLRATVVTVAINMTVWLFCIHTSNQIAVQRYFSTSDTRAARRSFLVGVLANVAISLMLTGVGLAVLYYYLGTGRPLDGGLDPATKRDLIFPTYVAHHLPQGAAGAILTALLAAAMSSVDSGVNSIATVVSLELHTVRTPGHGVAAAVRATENRTRTAMVISLAAGTTITVTAILMSYLPAHWGIVGAIPRTFNAVTGPLGGLFFAGFFLPRVGQRAAIGATCLGLVSSIVLGYLQQIGGLLQGWGAISAGWPEISFTWILPCSFLITILAAAVLAVCDPARPTELAGLTWSTRHENP